MQIKELLKLLRGSDAIRIVKNNEQVYIGYMGSLEHKESGCISGEEELKGFKLEMDIKHKKWEELGLMQPLQPEETAQYSFSDLQFTLYYAFYI